MDVNYWVIALVVLLIIVLFILFIKKNRKDEESLLDEIKQSELRPEKGHNDADNDNLV